MTAASAIRFVGAVAALAYESVPAVLAALALAYAVGAVLKEILSGLPLLAVWAAQCAGLVWVLFDVPPSGLAVYCIALMLLAGGSLARKDKEGGMDTAEEEARGTCTDADGRRFAPTPTREELGDCEYLRHPALTEDMELTEEGRAYAEEARAAGREPVWLAEPDGKLYVGLDWSGYRS